jgi:hypothetical protein
VCGGGKTIRDADARVGQIANHFPKGGIFAADDINVVHPQLVKPKNIIVCHHEISISRVGKYWIFYLQVLRHCFTGEGEKKERRLSLTPQAPQLA